MIQRLIAWKLCTLMRWLDDSVPSEKIQAFLQKNSTDIPKTSKEIIPSPELIQNWLTDHSAGKGEKDIEITPQTRSIMVWMDEHGDASQQKVALDIMEHLLRHVEVKRKKCFITGVEYRTTDHIWQQRHDVSILFCRYAIRHHDLRFLNAAFKLNDWAFRHYQHAKPSAAKSSYLAALQEQELAAKELLR
jgi:hypothetical protein